MISLAPVRPHQRQRRRRDILRQRMAVRSLSVLIVDENADDRRRLVDLLQSGLGTDAAPSARLAADEDRSAAYELSIRECGSGLAALEILRGRRIDLVLVDRLLPDMAGVELISAVAEMSHDTAVILTSRTNSGADAAAAMKNGARDYLPKRDMSAAALRHAVEEAVRSARLDDQVGRQTRRLQRSSLRVAKFVQSAQAKINASTEQAQTAMQELRQSPVNPLRDLTAHFHRVEHSLRESRQFLADLTRLCERAGLVKE